MTTEEILRRNAERKRALAEQQMHKQRARLGLDNGFSGGGGGGIPAANARGNDHGPETLTEKFNRASMAGLSKLSKNDERLNELRGQVREAINQFNREGRDKGQLQGLDSGVNGPASRLVAEQLEKQRAQMRPTLTPSPTGTIQNTFDPKQQRDLSHRIKHIHERLDRQKGVAMDAFNNEVKKGYGKGL